MTQDRARALAEARFAESVLAKTGQTILTAALAGAARIEHWQHFPQGDAHDPASGATWFYHCHAPDPGPESAPESGPASAARAPEHGHFHCFVRPEGPDGPIHHLIAIGMDARGQMLRLFTVNQWVVADDWLDAEATIALLPRFDAHLARPCYLVNRWLTAIIRAYQDDIARLIRARDTALSAHRPATPDTEARADRSLEITSVLEMQQAT